LNQNHSAPITKRVKSISVSKNISVTIYIEKIYYSISIVADDGFFETEIDFYPFSYETNDFNSSCAFAFVFN